MQLESAVHTVTVMRLYTIHLLERLPCTSLTTVAFFRTLVIAHCGLTPMTCRSCSCREHIINLTIGASRPPVFDCGTTFHSDCGDRDCPSTPLHKLRNLIYLVTEAHSDSFEFIRAVQMYLSIDQLSLPTLLRYHPPLHTLDCVTVARMTDNTVLYCILY